jgi:ferric-dicitrate binding protein FerR (iron transport regulator)
VNNNFQSAEEVMADDRFLAWYFQTNPQQAAAWEQWLSLNPQSQPLVQEAIRNMEQVYIKEKEVPEEQTAAAWERFQNQSATAPVVTMKPRRTRWWIPAAAAILLIIAGFALWQAGSKKVFNSDYGQVSEYRLPDGSMVTLNANSQLSMSGNWTGNHDREVWIKGEAFFNIQKTAQKNRFIVHAEEMDIIVTGTQFNVVNTDHESSVLLTEGSVTVKTRDGRELHMKPGDFVRIDNETVTRKPADQEKQLAWKQSMLVFDNTTLADVGRIIRRHYGIEVKIASKELETKTLSGIMPNNNLDMLISAIEGTGDFKITKQDKEIIISNP